MKINSRTINFYEIQIHTLSRSDEIKRPPQQEFGPVIEYLSKNIQSKYEIKFSNTPIEVTDSHWDAENGELHLLLNMADPNRSDVSYKSRKAKTRRPGTKTQDEDIEVSSHVIIKPNAGTSTAKFAMTSGAGIPPSKVVSLIKDLYKQQINSAFIKNIKNIPMPTGITDKSGNKITYKVSHSFQFNGMPNSSILEIIEDGKIVGANLIDTGTYEFDSTSNIHISSMQMHVELRSQSVDLPFIKRLIGKAKKNKSFNADKIRIDYIEKSVDSDDEHVKHKTFESGKLEDAFTRSEVVKLDTDHDDHQSKLSKEIIDKMRELL